ncbi:hypothetical protein EWM64_g4094 [Hericium alpestre]|uniref:RRM domain-containing protein n=1 Tax=Hericium alpestre TaxID=135208 RepID=A0A4Y9ZYE6_9AGAM|nr:hypothetical protein EWM64_g4094 [Hericium alpestre]
MTVPTPFFKFGGREEHAVMVENIPCNVNRREVVDLFTTLVGQIKDVEVHANGTSMQLAFFTADAATKSLCMSGYTVAGVPLSVTATNHPKPMRPSFAPKSSDARRNLYVLGLPFDLSKAEFAAIFSRYGTVSHCVILATVDNASRRRGFVVMSSNAEAKVAMDAITRTEIRGSIVDVSWAVVQRSQGFLDGGDRTMALDTRFDSPSCSTSGGSSPEPPFTQSRSHSFEDLSNRQDMVNGGLAIAASLLVSNLPTLLFSNASDFKPLFMPFGKVEKLEILPASPNDSIGGMTSVVVTYTSAASAREAKQDLHGQVYAGFTISARLLLFPLDRRGQTSYSGHSDSGSSSGSTLNPRASPFVCSNAYPPSFSAPPTCAILENKKDYFGMANGRSLGYDYGSSGAMTTCHPFSQMSLPASNVPSRASSVVSRCHPSTTYFS